MLHRLPPISRDPEIGDLCRIAGPGAMPRKFFRHHGVGMIVKKHRLNPDSPAIQYEIKSIKKKYNKKIISAITVETKEDILKYKKYEDYSDIILFDSKGYEKSLEFDHTLMKNVPVNVKRMIAGNIKYDDNLDKFMKICNYIDISGGVETSGLKDISKVKIFLDNVKKLND